jgi:hypothetical protein
MYRNVPKWTSRLYSVIEACSVSFCSYILCEGLKHTQAVINNDSSLSRIVSATDTKSLSLINVRFLNRSPCIQELDSSCDILGSVNSDAEDSSLFIER